MVKRLFDISPASSLPKWKEPKDEGSCVIEIIHFLTSTAENVYNIGKHLLWVKDRVKHGEFGRWVDDHLPISQRTAQRFMVFAKDCDDQNRLLEYHPEKERQEKTTKLPQGRPHQPARKTIKQIAREITWERRQKRQDVVFGTNLRMQQDEDRETLERILARLYDKWGREILEEWIREIVKSL